MRNYQAAKKSKEELNYKKKSNRTHFDMNCWKSPKIRSIKNEVVEK